MTVKATSTVGAGSISVGVGMGAEANVSAESIARAAGIRGGEGNDTIRNEGTLTVEASAIAGAGSIAVGVKQEDSEDQQDPAQTARQPRHRRRRPMHRQKQPQPLSGSPAEQAMTASSTSRPST